MQIVAETTKFQSLPSATLSEFSVTVRQSQFSQCRVIRRNGAVVSFEPSEISVAVTKVFLAVDDAQGAASAELQLQVIDDGLEGSLFLENLLEVRAFCTRTCFRADLARDSVRRGLPRWLNSLCLFGQV